MNLIIHTLSYIHWRKKENYFVYYFFIIGRHLYFCSSTQKNMQTILNRESHRAMHAILNWP